MDAMSERTTGDGRQIAAGDFSTWMDEIQGALRGERGSDVPCGSCTACCTSSQFIHIAPDETGTLARIPEGLLFPAPHSPRGHVLLGYDHNGHCPMLVDNQCSIYTHRPRTCRTYDCRVFPAAGLDPEDDDKVLIAERARRWEFSYATEDGRTQHAAVRAAAAFLGERADDLPTDAIPTTTTQLAVRAIELHDMFVNRDEVTGETSLEERDLDAVRVQLTRRAHAD
jgi:Fe-S-cluster containining protein